MEDQINQNEVVTEEAVPAPQVTGSNPTSLNDVLAIVGAIVILGGGFFLFSKVGGGSGTGTEGKIDPPQIQPSSFYHCGENAFKFASGSKQIVIEPLGKTNDECLFSVRVNGKAIDTIDTNVVQRLSLELQNKPASEITLQPSDAMRRVVDISLDVSNRFRQGNDAEKVRSTVAVQFKDAWLNNAQLRGGDKVVARLFGVASYEKAEYLYLPCYKVQSTYIPQNKALYIKFNKLVACSSAHSELGSGVKIVNDTDTLWTDINEYYKKAFAEAQSPEALPDIVRQANKIADDMSAGNFTEKKIVFLTPGDFKPLGKYQGVVPRGVCSPNGEASFIGLDYNDNLEYKDQQEKIIRALFANCAIKSLIYNNNP